MPVGGVAVYKDKVPPAGVGFDIACVNKVLTNLGLGDIKGRFPRLADETFVSMSFGIGHKNTTPLFTRFATTLPGMRSDFSKANLISRKRRGSSSGRGGQGTIMSTSLPMRLIASG